MAPTEPVVPKKGTSCFAALFSYLIQEHPALTEHLLHAMQALSLLSHSPRLASILAPKPAFVKRGPLAWLGIAADGLTVAGPGD